MDQNRCVHIGDRFPHRKTWKKLLNKWKSMMDEYVSRSRGMNAWASKRGGDLPYWHKIEVTNLGMLSAAVWCLKGVAVCEFSMTRGRGKTGRGHGDMWFSLNGLSCYIEAKGTDPSTDPAKRIKNCLGEARKDMKDLQNSKDEKTKTGVALCFVVPSVAKNKNPPDLSKLIAPYRDPEHLAFVYQPGVADSVILDDEGDKGYRYPGVALIGKLVWPDGREEGFRRRSRLERLR